MKEIIFQVEEAGEGGYVARALGYSIFTEAETLEELRTTPDVRSAVGARDHDPRSLAATRSGH